MLEELGFDDPSEQEIPKEFLSSAWHESGKDLKRQACLCTPANAGFFCFWLA